MPASTASRVRLRTAKTKGCLSRATALGLVFKLARSAERHWRRLNGSDRRAEILRGVRFRDGEPITALAVATAFDDASRFPRSSCAGAYPR